jgi:hypothetical protein
MATEKQIAANRANAFRSTGPKTAAGKLKASRNSYRHGLSGPMMLDSASAIIETIVRELVGEAAAGEDRQTLAVDFARAQVGLLRIRSVRTKQLENADRNNFTVKELRRLAALDRYERYALTTRRRASLKLRREE